MKVLVFTQRKQSQRRNNKTHSRMLNPAIRFSRPFSLSIFSHALTRGFRCHRHIKGEFIIRQEKDNTLSA